MHWKNGDRPYSGPPESQESNSIPVTLGINHCLFYYTSVMVMRGNNGYLSNSTQTVQTSVLN